MSHDDSVRTDTTRTVRIVDFEPRHRDAFRDLDLEWIETYFVVEDADRRQLDDPEGILRDCGAILMAEEGDAVIDDYVRANIRMVLAPDGRPA